MLTFGSFLIKALWKMKVWALKKYRKNQFGPVLLLMIQIVIKTKQPRYDFLALVCFFFGKQLIFLKIKRALRILESETQICAIEEDIL